MTNNVYKKIKYFLSFDIVYAEIILVDNPFGSSYMVMCIKGKFYLWNTMSLELIYG